MQTLLNSKEALRTGLVTLFLIGLNAWSHAQFNVTITPSHVTCNGAANGSAQANPSGGASPYTYVWSNSATTQSIQGLAPGTYSVTVKDANQSSKTAITMITQPPVLMVSAFATSTICSIAPDGTAAAVPSGGTPVYHYLWSNGETTPSIQNLSGGTYTVTVTDANACTALDSCVVNSWDEGLWTMITSTPATCAYNDGSAHVSIMSGTPPYQYHWSNGGTDATIDQLSAGTYTVTVSDANGCATNTQAFVTSSFYPSILIQFQDPFCLQPIALFIADLPPFPDYPDISWSLGNPADQIIAGQGTDSVRVQWGSTGARTVEYQYGANGINCGSVSYHLNVVVCAHTTEAWISQASVAPNPFSGVLDIQMPEGASPEIELILTDVSGKKRVEQKLESSSAQVSTEALPAGFYFLTLRAEGVKKVWKLAKN